MKTFEQYKKLGVDIIMDMFNARLEGFYFYECGFNHVELNNDEMVAYASWYIPEYSINSILKWAINIPHVVENPKELLGGVGTKEEYLDVSEQILAIIDDKEYINFYIDSYEIGLL